MKILEIDKDGGEESNAWAYWLIEWKSVFSIALLRFSGKSRECFHTHAFNAVSWVLRGELAEAIFNGSHKGHQINYYKPHWKPILTKRDTFHQVSSYGDSWAITFRGPWSKTWKENTAEEGTYSLKSGRQKI